jgi:hypothetical protein
VSTARMTTTPCGRSASTSASPSPPTAAARPSDSVRRRPTCTTTSDTSPSLVTRSRRRC